MIKRYCDCCSVELCDDNKIDGGHFKLTGEIKGPQGTDLIVEIVTAKHNTWDSGDFCKYCVIDAINREDDRKKEGCSK